MKTKSICICKVCENPIYNKDEGVIVHGNIYVADPDNADGLIGNNFPKKGTFVTEEVQTSAFCKMCFLKSLRWPEFINDSAKPVISWEDVDSATAKEVEESVVLQPTKKV